MKIRILENQTLTDPVVIPPRKAQLMNTALIKIGWLTLILLPPAIMLIWVGEFAVNVPFSDEWSMTPLVIKLHTGGFTFSELWAPHNEHRIPVLRLTLLVLAELGGWD